MTKVSFKINVRFLCERTYHYYCIALFFFVPNAIKHCARAHGEKLRSMRNKFLKATEMLNGEDASLYYSNNHYNDKHLIEMLVYIFYC